MTSKIQMTVFSGGRGTASICEVFKQHPQIDLTVLVNTYDDGLSTGQLRRFIPGMLGPSDIRKNISYFIAAGDRADRSLQRIVEYRLPKKISREHGLKVLERIARGGTAVPDEYLEEAFANLRLAQARPLFDYANAFLDYYGRQNETAKDRLEFSNCSVGNLLFAGCYLAYGCDFNSTVAAFSSLCEIGANVLNISDGTPGVLVGLTEDGKYLTDEASIVTPAEKHKVSEVFLLPDYLSESELRWSQSASSEELRDFLRGKQIFPRVNPDAKAALERADLIVYGPGTQHSSLLPSYLTQQVGSLVANNHGADKIFISNLSTDYEIRGETVNSLVAKVIHYLNGKGQTNFSPSELITTALVQVPEVAKSDLGDGMELLACDTKAAPFTDIRTVMNNWHDGQGRHAGSLILDELIRGVNRRLRIKLGSQPYMVSIVVPGWNEQATVRDVLASLTRLDLKPLGLKQEIIFVDGGSTDQTLEEARSVPGVRVYQLPHNRGRGAALRFGMDKAIGDTIAFFPSDGEYSVSDLKRAIAAMGDSREKIVFGSRTIKCLNLNHLIHRVYKSNYLGYLISKYGGLAVSLCTMLFHSRFVTDPFTGIKVFNARLLRDFELRANGLDLETEILAKACRSRTFILEIPVQYAPRTRQQGKKTRVFDGLKALRSLLWWSIRPWKKVEAAQDWSEAPPSWPFQERVVETPAPEVKKIRVAA